MDRACKLNGAEEKYVQDNQITNPMELSTTRQSTSFVDTREFRRILRHLKVHSHIMKSFLIAPILSQPHLYHSILFYLSKIHLNLSTHVRPPSGHFPLASPPTTHTRLCSHSHHMLRPPHPLRLIILIIFGEEYKSCSSSLCGFLHPPVT
jgi:hypothetical protein